jgi:hypothetical protein
MKLKISCFHKNLRTQQDNGDGDEDDDEDEKCQERHVLTSRSTLLAASQQVFTSIGGNLK